MKYIASALAAVLTISVSATAFASEKIPYEATTFQAAQKAGKPILVEIYAPWCPVCKAQGKVIQSLKAKPEYKSLTVFVVDFDNQKSVVRDFGARQQSTLIAFKGAKEGDRLSYNSDAAEIEKVVKSAF